MSSIKTFLITGGARSGKSSFAENLALNYNKIAYIATALPSDDEMQSRILKHQQDRPKSWKTFEETVDIVDIIKNNHSNYNVFIIDCLTLWLSNLLYYEKDIKAYCNQFLELLQHPPTSMIMVSNEVGLGIVPENALARQFRDMQGRLNQNIAKEVNNAYFIVAGLPITLK
jgi:adenosylcobinamide kinase/adenosylcobinamide-phosphate guanylyltransferase